MLGLQAGLLFLILLGLLFPCLLQWKRLFCDNTEEENESSAFIGVHYVEQAAQRQRWTVRLSLTFLTWWNSRL